MKRKICVVLLIVFLCAFAAVTVSAQPWSGWRGSGGWGMGTPYQGTYNPATVETVKGEVTGIEQTVPMRRMHTGVAVMLKTDKETIAVHLGPSWYIERLETKLVKGDKIEVTGSRVTIAGKPALIASQVKKGAETLTLRDSAGVPVWAGWGRTR